MNSGDREFLVRFICESDAIESITDDPALVRAQIENRHTHGHVGALLLLNRRASQKISLTPALIKRTQSLIVEEQHEKGGRRIAEKYCGNWRDCDVWIGGRKGTPPEHISSRMFTLTKAIARWQIECVGLSTAQKVTTIARFHYDYEHVHPFIDGNGRSGRALVHYLYRFAGLAPFVFTANDRHETYYRCFKDPADMQEYFFKRTA